MADSVSNGGDGGPDPDPLSREPIPGFADVDAYVQHVLGSVVKATRASMGMPSPGEELDFYQTFPAVRNVYENSAQRLLNGISNLSRYYGCRGHVTDSMDPEERFEGLVDATDTILERVGTLLDEVSGVNKNKAPVLPKGTLPPKTIVSSWNRRNQESASARGRTFHALQAKNIARPQLSFTQRVDNSNAPFLPKLRVKPNALKPLPAALSSRRDVRPDDLDVPPALADLLHQQRTHTEEDVFAHPYQFELESFTPSEELLQEPEPQKFRPLEETPLSLVTSLEELAQVNEKLLQCKEFAVDLEHHSYRSFLGITCLMQISTREEDFIIDTLILRDDLHILNEAFTNPNIIKVFHGADSDIEWLQRDLGLYVVGLFDTHAAARSLGLARNSLAHLLMHYCSLSTDKQYQLADWRIRPLLPDMLHYARADTHYLLYVYDRARADLLTKALGRPNLLQLVWDQSRTVALKRYHKPVFTEDSYMELLHKHKQPLDVQQSSAARLLYAWRDRTARAEDESTGYVLPNHMLMKIAEEMPRELQGVLACCNPVPPLVRQNANELWQLVKQARLIPLIKSETPIKTPSRTIINRTERLENPLFCPHDGLSLDDGQPITRHGTEVEGARRAVPATRPVLALFDDSEEQQNEARTAQSSTSQMKAARVLQTFVNPFGMYLPSSDGKSLPFQEKKLDPNSKVFEICSRWKLMKAPEAVKPKKSSAQPAKAKHAEKKIKVERPQEEPVAVPTVREQKQGATRREAPGATEVTEVGGKRQRANSSPAPPLVPDDFTPHEYTEADAHIFTAGCSRGRDNNRHTTRQGKQKLRGRGQGGRTVFRGSARGMTYMQGHSGRGGSRQAWPKK
ncbi:exosome complex component 10 isoform X1 [Lethenteron reissneri]|uniref:exosome complex component 10 isoform X1 n=1 Tax=Lethenteron reissneri TaxID=7753 RepID=UPI002AB790CD|nr:exosome complex component 10 isoform X1 [Lethenteron reissneri]